MKGQVLNVLELHFFIVGGVGIQYKDYQETLLYSGLRIEVSKGVL